MKGCKRLDGIMDLVVFLENKMLSKDEHENLEDEEQEERPITITDFSTAVGEIHKKLDKLIQVTEHTLEDNNENIKRTRVSYLQRIAEGSKHSGRRDGGKASRK
eukprot:3678492-Heterocapsa_arctica.AAC.1